MTYWSYQYAGRFQSLQLRLCPEYLWHLPLCLLSVLRWGRPTMRFTSPWSRPPLRTMCPFSGPPCLSWRPITTTLLPITLSPLLCWTTSVSQATNHSSWPSPIGWQPTGTFKRLPLCLLHRDCFLFLGRVKDSGISVLMDFYSALFFLRT